MFVLMTRTSTYPKIHPEIHKKTQVYGGLFRSPSRWFSVISPHRSTATFPFRNKRIHYLHIASLFLSCHLRLNFQRSKTKRTATGRPTYLVYHSWFCFVYSQYFQLLALILMKNPILKTTGSLAIIKLQKRSESNVLSKLSINKIYRKKRLRKCRNPTTSKTPDVRCQGF